MRRWKQNILGVGYILVNELLVGSNLLKTKTQNEESMDQRRFNQTTRHSKKKRTTRSYSSNKLIFEGKRGKPIWWLILSTDWNITRHC
jgi:hypothetical protein